MCGRARLSSDVSEIKLVFSIPPERPTPNIPANWNAAPTEDLPVVRYDARAGQRSLDVLRWGLVPFWAKDIKVGFANINAKAEGIATRPAFREAFAPCRISPNHRANESQEQRIHPTRHQRGPVGRVVAHCGQTCQSQANRHEYSANRNPHHPFRLQKSHKPRHGEVKLFLHG